MRSAPLRPRPAYPHWQDAFHSLPVEASPAQHPPGRTSPKCILAITAITLDGLEIRIVVVPGAVAIVVAFPGHR